MEIITKWRLSYFKVWRVRQIQYFLCRNWFIYSYSKDIKRKKHADVALQDMV